MTETISALTRWTAFVYVAPRRYVDPVAASDIDIETWSEGYDWRQDKWNGYLDLAKPVSETIRDQSGDCEDYALVVASWAFARGEHVRLGFCFRGAIPRHVVAVTDRVFSSGEIWMTSLDGYLDETDYDRAIIRPV